MLWPIHSRKSALAIPLLGLLVIGALASPARRPAAQAEPALPNVRGMTISCQTNGREWGSAGFGSELEELAGMGVNWVAIHPYARIRADGLVSWRRFDPADPPVHIAHPVAEARRRGVNLLIKPHLAYWGSPFSWRGDIHFEEPAARERFFQSYQEWVVALAEATRGAHAFCIGTELDRLLDGEEEWREIIHSIRKATPLPLTYAANWTDYEAVPFWDALDVVGVQAYFPIAEGRDPSEAELRKGWSNHLSDLRSLHEKIGKPVVFTELGYDLSLEAASKPWKGRPWHGRGRSAAPEGAEDLQRRCLRVALSELARESDWLRGAFLWKWFVGPTRGEDFLMSTSAMRGVISSAWLPDGR